MGLKPSREETMRIEHCAFAATAALALSVPTASVAQPPTDVSGYEFLLGTSCTIEGQPATCDVQFGGWTGGEGQIADGWTPFPGDDRGLWKATVDYTGKAAFGGQVKVVDGRFDLLFTSGKIVLGKVRGGKVTWPAAGQSIGCGKNVATVSLRIGFRAGATGAGSFRGCLHDLPAGSVIPPKIWGTLE
jgi:hypothetical protein